MPVNFYIVYCKTRRKFDKYVKINCVRNKVIVDVEEMVMQEDAFESDIDRDYFNLMVYTKISHSLKKSKDIYYIPDFTCRKTVVGEVMKFKHLLGLDINFNAIIFFDEFKDDKETMDELFNNISNFNTSQIIKDY